MNAKSNDARDFKGDPPCDGREWKSLPDVAAKLGIKHGSVWSFIRRWQWTTYRQNGRRTWLLKSDVDSYLEFKRLKKRWYERHRPQTWRAEIGIIEDEDLLKRVFITSTQAALMMGVSSSTVSVWGQKGKIPVFKSSPTSRRTWYSPSSLRYLRENPEHLKKRALWKKGKETQQAGIVDRQVYKLRYKPRVYRKPPPPGWLSVRDTAELLDISQGCVHKLRRKGRLFGKQLIKGRLEDTRGWMMPELNSHRPWFFHVDVIEEYKNDEENHPWRERGKQNNARGCRK